MDFSHCFLAYAAIDATMRDTDVGDYTSNSKRIFGGDADLEWLRILRNRLVHATDRDQKPYISVEVLDDVAASQERLEADARRSVTLLFRSIYANPGT